jgi:hypothetical protein
MSKVGMTGKPAAMTPEQRKANARLGLILGAIAVFIFVAFIVKSVVLSLR